MKLLFSLLDSNFSILDSTLNIDSLTSINCLSIFFNFKLLSSNFCFRFSLTTFLFSKFLLLSLNWFLRFSFSLSSICIFSSISFIWFSSYWFSFSIEDFLISSWFKYSFVLSISALKALSISLSFVSWIFKLLNLLFSLS